MENPLPLDYLMQFKSTETSTRIISTTQDSVPVGTIIIEEMYDFHTELFTSYILSVDIHNKYNDIKVELEDLPPTTWRNLRDMIESILSTSALHLDTQKNPTN